MKLTVKLGGVTVALALGIAPAIATAAGHPGGPGSHPGGPGGTPAATHSNRCRPHKVAYIASGKLNSSPSAWSLTQNSDGTWSGTVTVDVLRTNHHARGDRGTTVTYTLDHGRVRLGNGVANPPAAGSRVRVIGKITELARRCDHTGFTPTVTVRQVVVHAATSSSD
jgi:hypothetical protein